MVRMSIFIYHSSINRSIISGRTITLRCIYLSYLFTSHFSVAVWWI